MDREAVVAYLSSLSQSERDAVTTEANHRAYPFHRRRWSSGEVFCARLVGEDATNYEIDNCDDVSLAMENAIKYSRDVHENERLWVDDHSTRID